MANTNKEVKEAYDKHVFSSHNKNQKVNPTGPEALDHFASAENKSLDAHIYKMAETFGITNINKADPKSLLILMRHLLKTPPPPRPLVHSPALDFGAPPA